MGMQKSLMRKKSKEDEQTQFGSIKFSPSPFAREMYVGTNQLY